MKIFYDYKSQSVNIFSENGERGRKDAKGGKRTEEEKTREKKWEGVNDRETPKLTPPINCTLHTYMYTTITDLPPLYTLTLELRERKRKGLFVGLV